MFAGGFNNSATFAIVFPPSVVVDVMVLRAFSLDNKISSVIVAVAASIF